MTGNYPVLSAVWGQNRGRAIVIIILLLLVVGAYGVQRLVIEPNLLDLRTEQSRLQQQVRQRQLASATSGVPVSAAEQLEKNLQRFNRLVPPKNDFSVFLGELFAWSAEAGLQIDQVSYQHKYEEETGFLRYGLAFSVKGDYSRIKRFLHLLENADRILMIERISLTGVSSATQDVDLRIELATFFQERST